MEEIIICSICTDQFDSVHIPKMLECGHTFCSICLTRHIEEDPRCPNCRTEIKGPASSLSINYHALKVIEFFESKRSIINLRKKCMERKEILSKPKSSFTSSLEVLDECLEKLEELTLPEKTVDTVNVKKILKEVEEEFKKTIDVTLLVDIKSSMSILLSSFENSEDYLLEIYKRIQNEEKIFAVCKFEDKIKYGKVSSYENKLFFHSLSLSEVPTDSSLIWFQELKQCSTTKNFYTFLEICCNNKRLTLFAIIEMFDKQHSLHFIKMCTGEYGPSFKGASFERGVDGIHFKGVLHIKNLVENSQKCSRLLEFNFSTGNIGFYKYKPDQMFLCMDSAKGNVSILLTNVTDRAAYGIIGKVISPTDLKDCINYDHSSFLKILDCGIILEV